MLATPFVAAFGAGLLASLSPCVYPLLPVTLGFLGGRGTEGRKLRILSYFAGQTLALVALGLTAVWAGETLGFSSEISWVNAVTGTLLLLFGVLSLNPALGERIGRWGEKVTDKILRRRTTPGSPVVVRTAAISALLLGASSALVISPCTSPILGAVLATLAAQATLIRGIVMMFLYALGFSSLFLVLGLGILRLQQVPRAGAWMLVLNRLSSLLLMGAGFYYLVRAGR